MANKALFVQPLIMHFIIQALNRGADPRARRMGAGLPANIRRAQSGQVPCSGAERRDKVLDEVSTAIHGGEAAVNK
jgi:hypothetical protein